MRTFSVRSFFAFLLSFSIALSGAIPARAGTTTGLSVTTAYHILQGHNYSAADGALLLGAGGTAPYTFTNIADTKLQANGIVFHGDGTLTGLTCGNNGSDTITGTVTDNTGASASFSTATTINTAPSGTCNVTITVSGLPAGTSGGSYSGLVSASSSACSNFTYSISSGSLPPGLTLNGSTGAITGTPTATGTYTFFVTAMCTGGNGSASASITINTATLTITTATLSVPAIPHAYSQTILTQNGTAPITFSVSAGALPAGLTLNTSTGAITGTPTTPGAYNFTIQAKDANNVTAAQAYSGTIVSQIAITTAALPTPLIGQAYSQTVGTSGGTSPIVFSISSGALPAGLSISSTTGAITGTPTAAGPYSFTVQATDANSVTASKTYTGTIASAIAITTATLPAPLIGQPYSQTVATSGGTAPIAFSISSGALPAGLSISGTTGAVTGTPSASGAYNFTVKATDANSVFATQAYTGTIVSALAITTATLPTPIVNSAYNQTVATSGGTAPITFSIATGSLPAGLTLNTSTGAITGTATASGAYSFTVQAKDANNVTASQAYSGTIAAAGSFNITTLSVTTPLIGQSYSQTIGTAGGTAPIAFALGGTLPTGLSLDGSTGIISGTPTASGTYNFTISATDSSGTPKTASQAYSVTVAPALTITTASVATPVLGQSYAQTVATTGGTAPLVFSISSGALPAGLSIDSTSGTIGGTPTASGAFTFTVQAKDANNVSATKAFSVTIAAAVTIATATLTTPLIGQSYNQTISTSGGTAPIAFSITSGALPHGLTLNTATGAITGTPDTPGTYSFAVTATDANNLTDAKSYSGTIVSVLTIATSSLPVPLIDQTYNQTVTTSGGTAPVTFTISAGSLPAGLSLGAATGVISGTPTASGAYDFTVQAQDANSVSATKEYTGTIAAAIAITTATLPAPLINQSYNQTVHTSGGTSPIAFALVTGSLPAGLSLDASTGVISGTASASGTYAFTVQAMDTNGVATTQAYSGTIVSAIAITTATLPVPLIGQTYNQTVATSGGTAPIAFSIAAGALPAGLSLNASSGVITGTPTASGSYDFTVKATDANSVFDTKEYTGTIAASITITTAALPAPLIAQSYNQTVNTSGGTAPVAFSISAGALPAGLTLNTSSGAITGSPTAAGAYDFTVKATDANSVYDSKEYTGTIVSALAITTASLPAPLIGQSYNQTVNTSGGTAPVGFSISAGTLPAGLSLDASTGVISGTPTATGTYSFTVKATDKNNVSDTKQFTGTIVAAIAITTATLPVPLINQAYNHSVATSGGTAPVAFSISAGTLPAGLTLNTSSGAITGTPAAAGAYDFTVKATDANNVFDTKEYTGTIVAAIAITTATLPVPLIAQSYNQTIVTSGGTNPIGFTLSAGSLPTGLSLGGTSGAITGTPTATGAYDFTVKANDANSVFDTKEYTGTIVSAITITTASLPTPLINQAYNQTVAASGGTSPVAFSISAGTLPAGLSLNAATGAIAGTPNATGAYSFTVKANDANNVFDTKTYSGTIVAAIAITTATLPVPLIGRAYNQTVSTSGGTSPVSFSISAGALPAGLTLSASTGAIAGTPTATGAYSFTVKAADANSVFDTKQYTGTIVASIAITTATLPVPLINQPYSRTVATSGGTLPIAFSITNGSLPHGLTLNSSTGAITGIADTAGAYTYTVTATDANNLTDSKTYTGTIVNAIAITTATLPVPLINRTYSQTVQTSGGTSPVTFGISAGALPAGLSLNAGTGAVSRFPTATGTYSFAVKATDANGVSDTKTYAGTIVAQIAITTASLAAMEVNQPFSQTIATSGGTSPVTFGVTGGSLPPGLSLNAATGAVTGTPAASGAYSVSITATDANTITAVKTYTGSILAPLAITTPTLPNPVLNLPYSQTIRTSGGLAPVTLAITAGALPSGLTLNPNTGAIGGTATAPSTFSFTVTATDANGSTATQAYTGSIAAQLAITTLTLPVPLINQAYNQSIHTSGGTSPISFSVQTGSLPAGLTLNPSTGVISGTPAAAGAYSFTVYASDANGMIATEPYSGTIAAALAITTPALAVPLVNAPYNQTVRTSGGTAPVGFTITAGTLPAGLTLNPSTGEIGGTPTTPGAYTFTVTATDVNNVTAAQTYSGTIVSAIAITTATLPAPFIGVAYAQTVQTSGGTAPVTFAISGGVLPAGLTIGASTGVIGGSAVNAGAYSFTVTATDANGVTASKTYAGTIAAKIAITTTTLPVPLTGRAYNQTVQTTGGTAPVTCTLTGGTLPAGLSLDSSTCTISGTPSGSGAYAFTIGASDANGVTASQTYSGTISATLAIATLTLPVPLISHAYTQTVATTGGTAPIAFSVTSGALPYGLTLNTATGAISGTAVNAGAYTFTVTASDANNVTASKTYTGTIVSALAIATATLPVPALTQAYNQTIQTSGGTAPVTFAVTGGALPAGIALNAATGALSGTPAASGAYSFTVTATDANGVTATKTYGGTIAASLSITTATLPVPVIGASYWQRIQTSGGIAPVTFAVTGGTLPAGISLNALSGIVSGIASASGAYSFTVTATDSIATTASKTYSGTIGAPLAITTPTIPVPEVGAPYSQTVNTTGGVGPFTFAVTSGTLPPGLTLDANTGVISGTLTTAGPYSFTVSVTDANGTVKTVTYSGNVVASLAITTLTLPVPVISAAYNQTVATSGGNSPVTFSIAGGALPPGLSLNAASGAIGGTPTASGSYSFTIEATDSTGSTATQTYSGSIAAPLAIITPAIPVPEVGAPYSQTVQTTGGTGPFTFAVTGGTLPAGLTLDPHTGVISGTLTAAGPYSFTVTVTDANGTVRSVTYSGNVTAALAITTLTLPVPSINVAYAQDVRTSGGTAPVTFGITGGSLPAGLSLDPATGAISGTAAAPGSYTFTVTATDANSASAAHSYSGTILPPVAITTPSLPVPEAGQPYHQTVSTTGGVGPFQFAVTSGSLPAGLTLDPATGVITGTLASAGPYSFTVTVTDANGNTSSVTYSGDVAAAVVITTASIAVPSIDTAYAQVIATTGGTAPVTFAIAAGALPAGLVLNYTTGAITGTPTASGAYSFTVTATDASGGTSSQTYSGTIAPPVAITTPALPVPEQGQPYSQTVQTNGGVGPFAFAVTGGALPAGLTLDPNTGVISGTITTSGSYSFTVTVTDAHGTTSSQTYSGTVSAPLAITTTSIPVPPVGSPYSQTVQTTGGVAPLAFAVSSGSLPPGLTLDPNTGVISGTLSVPGPYTFTVEVTDARGVHRFVTFSGVVRAAVAVSPASLPAGMVGMPYTATITASGGQAPYQLAVIAGSLPAGLTFDASTGVVSGKPAAAGTATFTVQATDSLGSTGTTAYSLQIAARPDPSQNAGVRGLIAAQTSAMSRFASAQTENITRHLEQQHDGSRCASNDLQLVNTDQNRSFAQEDRNKQNASASVPLGKSCSNGGISAWTAGSLLFGSADGTGSSMLNFHTDGVTVGADARLSKQFLVGLAIGSAFDQTAIGTNDGSLRSGATNAAAYASFQPTKNLFFDALVGQADARFDGSRFDGNASSFMTSHRTGTGTFESLVAGLEYRDGRFEYSPYVRADALSSRFAAASDDAASPWSLSYAPMTASNTTFVAGVRGSIDLKTALGTVTPLARLELRDLSLGSQSQGLQYKDGFGPSYSMFTPANAQSGLSGSFGLRVSPNEHVVFQLDYDFEYVNGMLGMHTVRPELNLRF